MKNIGRDIGRGSKAYEKISVAFSRGLQLVTPRLLVDKRKETAGYVLRQNLNNCPCVGF